ncbi:hypothetical protein JD489_09280 [Aeromonas veronii]|uniref:hypothetical protein n=1 Tax=Aeromonas veronii TaxID=654 RepID=UPI0019202103|nr:hypothetical protein [Aeromonas veronii]MBL0477506.1 hypothetical protein [Aeromonas veronii]
MNRYNDIVELLTEVHFNITRLEEKYEKAKRDESIKDILRPLVKTCLEHLRSALEYSAQDIWESYNNCSAKLFFPYGETEALFKANVKRNLPKLHEQRELYNIVESIQPHACGNIWLIELCRQTNFNKHISLGRQVRENSKKSVTQIGGLIRMDSSSTVTFKDCNYNGMPLGWGKPAVISGDMSTEEIRRNIAIPIPVSREFEWVEFKFENSELDTLNLIKRSHDEITQYIERLKLELSKHKYV